jgi:hypothetical protein
MKSIELTEQSVYQIKSILINDEIIKKLLYVQAPNALTHEAEITAEMVDGLISVVPYIQDDDGVENSSQSNFIVIYPAYFDLKDDQQHFITINIDIFVYKDYYLLNGAKIRLTQLFNRIVNLLQNVKLSFAERFTISDARLTNIDQGKTLGYMTSWSVVNGTAIQY